MVQLKDNIQQDLKSFVVSDFITAKELSSFSLDGILEEILGAIPKDIMDLINSIIDSIKEVLSSVLDTLEDVLQSLTELLQDALSSLGLSLEVRSFLARLLSDLCNDRLNFNLADFLLDLTLSLAITLSVCGSEFKFDTSLKAMLSNDRTLVELRSTYDAKVREWRNINRAKDVFDANDALNNQRDVLSNAINTTTDTDITDAISVRDNILQNNPDILRVRAPLMPSGTNPLNMGNIHPTEDIISSGPGSSEGYAYQRLINPDGTINPNAGVKYTSDILTSTDVSVNGKKLDLEKEDAKAIIELMKVNNNIELAIVNSIDPDIVSSRALVVEAEYALTVINTPNNADITNILLSIKNREEHIYSIFINIGANVIRNVTNGINDNKVSPSRAIDAMAEIMASLGDRIAAEVTLISLLNDNKYEVIPKMSIADTIVSNSKVRVVDPMHVDNPIDTSGLDKNIPIPVSETDRPDLPNVPAVKNSAIGVPKRATATANIEDTNSDDVEIVLNSGELRSGRTNSTETSDDVVNSNSTSNGLGPADDANQTNDKIATISTDTFSTTEELPFNPIIKPNSFVKVGLNPKSASQLISIVGKYYSDSQVMPDLVLEALDIYNSIQVIDMDMAALTNVNTIPMTWQNAPGGDL